MESNGSRQVDLWLSHLYGWLPIDGNQLRHRVGTGAIVE